MKKSKIIKPKKALRIEKKSPAKPEQSHPFCALPPHYFDRYADKSAADGRMTMVFTREPFFNPGNA